MTELWMIFCLVWHFAAQTDHFRLKQMCRYSFHYNISTSVSAANVSDKCHIFSVLLFNQCWLNNKTEKVWHLFVMFVPLFYCCCWCFIQLSIVFVCCPHVDPVSVRCKADYNWCVWNHIKLRELLKSKLKNGNQKNIIYIYIYI